MIDECRPELVEVLCVLREDIALRDFGVACVLNGTACVGFLSNCWHHRLVSLFLAKELEPLHRIPFGEASKWHCVWLGRSPWFYWRSPDESLLFNVLKCNAFNFLSFERTVAVELGAFVVDLRLQSMWHNLFTFELNKEFTLICVVEEVDEYCAAN